MPSRFPETVLAVTIIHLKTCSSFFHSLDIIIHVWKLKEGIDKVVSSIPAGLGLIGAEHRIRLIPITCILPRSSLYT